MDHAGFSPQFDLAEDHHEGAEQRGAQRYALLIRPAKLICGRGEFMCVLRDVSRSGARARLFHPLPAEDDYRLEMQSGQGYELTRVWTRGPEAGFEFKNEVDVSRVINEAGTFPKRGLRLALSFPVIITTPSESHMAFVQNISQQGARLECANLLAIDQAVRIAGEGLRETRAKVRWRRDNSYGVVFDDTFSLKDFALLAARLQAPDLLD